MDTFGSEGLKNPELLVLPFFPREVLVMYSILSSVGWSNNLLS